MRYTYAAVREQVEEEFEDEIAQLKAELSKHQWKPGLPDKDGRYAFAFDMEAFYGKGNTANRFIVLDCYFRVAEGHPYKYHSWSVSLIAHRPYPEFTEKDLEGLSK